MLFLLLDMLARALIGNEIQRHLDHIEGHCSGSLFVNNCIGRRWLSLYKSASGLESSPLRLRSTSSSSKKFPLCRESAECGLRKSVSSGEKIIPLWVLQVFQCIWRDPPHYLHACATLGLDGIECPEIILSCRVLNRLGLFRLRVFLSATLIDHQSSHPRDFSLSQWKRRMVQWIWWNGKWVSPAKQMYVFYFIIVFWRMNHTVVKSTQELIQIITDGLGRWPFQTHDDISRWYCIFPFSSFGWLMCSSLLRLSFEAPEMCVSNVGVLNIIYGSRWIRQVHSSVIPS